MRARKQVHLNLRGHLRPQVNKAPFWNDMTEFFRIWEAVAPVLFRGGYRDRAFSPLQENNDAPSM